MPSTPSDAHAPTLPLGVGGTLKPKTALGSAGMTIPITVTPARQGGTPGLSLEYDSRSGEGPFGFGWQLSLPAIERQTRRGVPRYDEHDVFALGGGENLIPVGTALVEGHRIDRFRPRVEGAPTRIERWTRQSDGDVHWRALSGDNMLSVFGRTSNERIADPADGRRVSTWLLSETRDAVGNAIVYEYVPEDASGVDVSAPHELGRRDRTAARYLKRVRYGNRTPWLDDDGRRPIHPTATHRGAARWLFELVLDYGDHGGDAPSPTPDRRWSMRDHPGSDRRAGFEVRQYRSCRRMLMFHHFPDEVDVGRDCLVSALELGYDSDQLTAVTRRGFVRREGGGYLSEAVPPTRLEYSAARHSDEVDVLGESDVENLTGGIGRGGRYWLDLLGNGMPGVLTEAGSTWFFKANLGAGRFEPQRAVAQRPSAARLGRGDQALIDLAGAGRLGLLELDGALVGFTQGAAGGAWHRFEPFDSMPPLDPVLDELQFVDLTGDGLADLVLSGPGGLRWHPSRAKNGFDAALPILIDDADDPAPRLMRATAEQSVAFADMTGDGLADLVRVRDGEVCYWPNLGHGRFGSRVVLENCPTFPPHGQFDGGRVRLADTDGSGTADVVYLDTFSARIWHNTAGDRLEDPIALADFPHAAEPGDLAVVDLLGRGTACLVWASASPVDEPRPIRYIDLMTDGPARLLTRVTNGFGKETRLSYRSSTQYSTDDRLAGRPWRTEVPFPLHVVSRVEEVDHIAGTRLVRAFAYRHGHWDADEREFRGFALVEQVDTEAFADYVAGIAAEGGHQESAPEFYQPAVTVRSWFHTGAFVGGSDLALGLASEYGSHGHELAASRLPSGLSTPEYRECVRALKGLMLRQETYSFDGSPDQARPFSTLEHRYAVHRVADGVVRPAGLETLTRRGERHAADERIEHSLVLRTGSAGQPVETAAVVYGRDTMDASLPAHVRTAQALTYVTCERGLEAPEIDVQSPVPAFRLPGGWQSTAYEVTGAARAATLFTIEELRDALEAAPEIDFGASPGAGLARRLIAAERTRFRDHDLAPAPFGSQDARGLVYETYRLAFTAPFLAEHYTGRVSPTEWAEAGYLDMDGDGNQWIPSGRQVFAPDAPQHFFLPQRSRDPFGIEIRFERDDYDLLLTARQGVQAGWDRHEYTQDYRVLAPRRTIDANRNVTAVRFDTLGRVVAEARTDESGAGTTLRDPIRTFEYEASRWQDSGQPNRTIVRARERWDATEPGWRTTYLYADGTGKAAMVKTEAPSGRWLASGWVVRNNKGSPVKTYEPYESDSSEYDALEALAATGVTPLLFYDALGRLVRTENPDGTFSTTTYESWRTTSADANDTVIDSTWYAERGMPDPAAAEPADRDGRAAWLAASHARTPVISHLDPLGRTVCVETDRGGGLRTSTRSELDLTGSRSAVFDELGRRVGSGVTSMSGVPVQSWSAERGSSWTFADATGAALKTGDEHGREVLSILDPLRRAIGMRVTELGAPSAVVHAIVYGDRVPDAAAANLNGIVHLAFDQAGVVVVDSLDVYGRAVSTRRRFTADHRTAPDWAGVLAASDLAGAVAAGDALLEPGAGAIATSQYDAMGRATRIVSPDGAVVEPVYDAAGRLDALAVRTGPQQSFQLLASQTYDPKGRPRRAVHGNGVLREWAYDDRSLRLASTRTTHGAAVLQDLVYTYDPVGNLVQIDDGAQPRQFFANAVVESTATFAYDAAYQLVTASGREFAAGNDIQRTSSDLSAATGIPHVNDTSAVRRYVQHYEYDAVGNIVRMKHVAPVGAGTWQRRYRYAHDIDPTDATNRLVATSRPGDPENGPYGQTYDYDGRGNFARLNLAAPGELRWNSLGQLERVDLGGGGTAYYAYGTDGARVRKVVERPGGIIQERRYLGALEEYRERSGNAPAHFVHRTLHLDDATGRFARIDTKVRDERGAEPGLAAGRAVARYCYGNQLGSTTLDTDDAGAVIGYEEYHPFGTSALRLSSAADGVSLKRFRYAGAERDDETGLHRMGLRYYAAWLGRWTSPDPAGFGDGTNLWRYARNNPATLSDPSGTSPPKLGDVSWEIPKEVYLDSTGKARSDADAITRFEAWVRSAHPGKEWEPGSTTIDWSTMKGRRGPTFWAKFREGGSNLPQRGDFGHVEGMRKQPPATYGTPGDKKTRETENEHTTPHAQQAAVDPDYDRSEYRKDPTVRSPRGVSLEKTKGDNARSAAIQSKVAAGQPVNITEEMDMASNEGFHAANETARKAGRPHIANPGSINRGTLEQSGARFERGKGTTVPPGAVMEDAGTPSGGRPAGAPQPSGPSTRSGGRFGSGGPGGVASTLGGALIPGFVEAELLGIYAAPLAAQFGVTGVVADVAIAASAAPTTFAFAVTLPALGGAIVGNAVENLAADLGAGKEVSIGAAVVAAAGIGAIIGTFIPIPGLGTVAGAAVGAVIGVIGYGLSKLFF